MEVYLLIYASLATTQNTHITVHTGVYGVVFACAVNTLYWQNTTSGMWAMYSIQTTMKVAMNTGT